MTRVSDRIRYSALLIVVSVEALLANHSIPQLPEPKLVRDDNRKFAFVEELPAKGIDYLEPKYAPDKLHDNFNCDELQRFMPELIGNQRSHVFKEDTAFPISKYQHYHDLLVATYNGEGLVDFKVADSIKSEITFELSRTRAQLRKKEEEMKKIHDELNDPNTGLLPKLRLRYLAWKSERDGEFDQLKQNITNLEVVRSYALYYEAATAFRNYKFMHALALTQAIKTWRDQYRGISMPKVFELELKAFRKLIEFCDKEPRVILQWSRKRLDGTPICDMLLATVHSVLAIDWSFNEKFRDLLDRLAVHSYQQCQVQREKQNADIEREKLVFFVDKVLPKLAMINQNNWDTEHAPVKEPDETDENSVEDVEDEFEKYGEDYDYEQAALNAEAKKKMIEALPPGARIW